MVLVVFGLLINGSGDKHGFNRMLDKLVTQVSDKVGKPDSVAVDAGYKTPHIDKFLIYQEIRPVMPYTLPRTKDGYLKKI